MSSKRRWIRRLRLYRQLTERFGKLNTKLIHGTMSDELNGTKKQISKNAEVFFRHIEVNSQNKLL